MKKDECYSVSMTTLMIVIPITAVIILIVYVFGIVAIPKSKATYDFIKDHGLFIAGISGYVADLRKFFLRINDENSPRIIIEDYHSSSLLKATFLQTTHISHFGKL